ncbi:leucine rich adaptor protein 1 [Danio rerio]|uniref:Leucine rich adaptor protein 1 n=1 Tax=Danio rerio TaxID=7955 RepID=A7MC09_DANRE|nr:leucine rich adaptor protein 1 [Danio rerio]AAI51996.1 Zgc:171930 protein [Danio rerio]|eukprot:NP_001099178.1 leucine rich adaptor protein 1 [Danio rerio]
MEESNNTCESVPDLKDLELKVGRKTPEGLLKWMREEHKMVSHHQTDNNETEKKGLDGKIRKLKMEMAHLRAADVKILNQLLALHEGIEAVKWLLEERGALTSRCSSLTSSQYSLGEGPDTSWRGSWSSLQDPHDELDNISIGSYLDTLADELDEYCPSSGTESMLCATPMGTGGGVSSSTGSGSRPPQVKTDATKEEAQVWNKAPSETARVNKTNGTLDKTATQLVSSDSPRACLAEKLGKNLSPKVKPYKNGKVELESCKKNGKVQLEYDAHWRWVQSQDDVTFL